MMTDIEFTGIRPEMVYEPRVTPLDGPAGAGSLADRIATAMDIPDQFARVVAMLPLLTQVQRMERALDEIAADAMADHHAAREAENVVQFRGRK